MDGVGEFRAFGFASESEEVLGELDLGGEKIGLVGEGEALGGGVRVAMASTPDETRPKHGVARHPTFASWDVGLREDLRAALALGTRRVVRFADPAGCALVSFEAGPYDPFFNV